MSRSAELLFLFKRDFELLRKELKQFSPEEKLWQVTGSITNSAGNLTLHLCGNLRHYIGAILGGSSYVRNREAEFSITNFPLSILLQLIDETERELEYAFQKLSNAGLEKVFPLEVLNRKWITETFIIHLYGHFNYHLGQINYLRRVL
ncbi:MAG: DUF1572 family protein [Bacteroidia bacterium]|nr:DUF1572 family protein [Bacteroidia bacterium]